MRKDPVMTRREAIEELRHYGIQGSEVYLIDIIPILEMIWADGRAQDSEVAILDDYLRRHVDHVKRLAGYAVLTIETARKFVMRFLRKRPAPELLRTLRGFIGPVRLGSSDSAENEEIQDSLLAACLDIASSAVTQYPYGLHDRFNEDEKRCFFEILETLESFRERHQTFSHP